VHRYSIQSAVALGLSLHLSLGLAAAPVLGIAVSRGGFAVDRAAVEGNATLFEGNRVETGASSSELRLNNGVRMRLASDSSGIVYRDRLVLERGGGEVSRALDAAPGPYRVEAGTLRIQPAAAAAAGARVAVRGERVQVAALGAPVTVTNAQGLLLARLAAGRAAEFTPEGGSGPSTLTGCVSSHDDKYWLSDEASSVAFEVIGGGVAQQVGSRVEITGSVSAGTNETNVVTVTSLKQLSKSCPANLAAAGAAGAGAAGAGAAGTGAAVGAAAAGTAAAGGAAIGASTAVIAGVVVAGAGAATAIAVVAKDDNKATISPSTR